MGNHRYDPPPPPQGPIHQMPPAPPQAPKSNGIGWMLATAAGLMLAGAVGSCSALLTVPTSATAVMPQATVTVAAPGPTVTVTPKQVKAPKPSPSPVVVGDGTWVVGDDIPAGTYKASAPVDSDCYWKISKAGTNGETIIQNDFPGGGRPQVTLRKGHDFHTARCGEWAKR